MFCLIKTALTLAAAAAAAAASQTCYSLPYLHRPVDPEGEGLMFCFIKAAVMAGLPYTHHKETSQAQSPGSDEHCGSNLA
jgi:hypothetical protein